MIHVIYKCFMNNENCWCKMNSFSNVGNSISNNEQVYIS